MLRCLRSLRCAAPAASPSSAAPKKSAHDRMMESSGANVRNPRLARQTKQASPAWRYALPVSLVLVGSAIAYVVVMEQRRAADGVCVDCVRQKEIMHEVYFAKRPPPPKPSSAF